MSLKTESCCVFRRVESIEDCSGCNGYLENVSCLLMMSGMELSRWNSSAYIYTTFKDELQTPKHPLRPRHGHNGDSSPLAAPGMGQKGVPSDAIDMFCGTVDRGFQATQSSDRAGGGLSESGWLSAFTLSRGTAERLPAGHVLVA